MSELSSGQERHLARTFSNRDVAEYYLANYFNETSTFLSTLKESKLDLLRYLHNLWNREGEYFQIGEYSVPVACFERIKAKMLIGKGSSGEVFLIDENSGTRVVKVVPLNIRIPSHDCRAKDPRTYRDCQSVSTEEFLREGKAAMALGQIGVAPKVYGYWICNQVEVDSDLNIFSRSEPITAGFIIADRVDTTLDQYIRQTPGVLHSTDAMEKLWLMYRNLVVRMLKAGYYDRDMHFSNIMINLDASGKPKQMFDVDLGLAVPSDQTKEETREIVGEMRSIFDREWYAAVLDEREKAEQRELATVVFKE